MNVHAKQNDAAAAPPVSAQTTLAITRFEKPVGDGAMTKSVELGADGDPVSDGSGCRMWQGKAETLTVQGAAGLAKVVEACTSQQAFAMGTVKPQFDNGAAVLNVVKDDALPNAPAGTIARTKEQFEFKAGQPAAMPLDYDQKGMGFSVFEKIEEAGGFWNAILDVAPGLTGAAQVTRASTSAGLVDTKTGKAFPGSGGLHVYVLVQDGADIPRAVDALHDRATLKGYGWGWISKAGTILPRSIVDASKGAAHDLSFEGPPILTPPLAQDAKARKAVAVEGVLVDTRTAIPDLTAGERVRVEAIRDAEKQRLEPKAQKIRDVWVGERVAQARKAGSPLPDEVLRQRFAGAYAGRLPHDMVLSFDDSKIGETTVGDVLADIQRFVGETLADPLEGVSYGRCKAKVMPTQEANEVWVHSFAHGGMNYQLLGHGFTVVTKEELAASDAAAAAVKAPSMDDVHEAVKALAKGDAKNANAVLDLLVRKVKARTPVNEELVVGAIQKALGKPVTLATVRGMLSDAKTRLASERAVWLEESLIWVDDSDPSWLTDMNQHYAILRDRPDAVFDLRGTARGLLKPLKAAAFHLLHANKFAIMGGDDPAAQSKLWIVHPRRREYATADDYPIGAEPAGALNLWTGLAVEPKAGKWPNIEEFLRDVICAGSLPDYAYMLDLIHWKIQNPTLNPEVAISLQGPQGVGKGTFGIFLQTVFGLKRYRLFGRPSDMANRFNAAAEGKLILFYDEAVFAHDPTIRGQLKSEITEHWQSIEPKGIDTYEVRNRALRIFASNDAAPIAIDLDDRRVFVLKVANIHAKDVAYFKALLAAFEGDEMAAFVHEALAADLSTFEKTRRNPPKTKAKAALAAATAKPEHEFLRELLDRGGPPPGASFTWQPSRYPRMSPEPKDSWRDGPVTVERDAPHKTYLDWMKNAHPRARPVNAAELHATIQQVLGAARFHSHPVRDGLVKRRVILLGSLDECRAAFDQYSEFKHEWP